MCADEISDLGFLDDLDVEHGALLAVECVHHPLEGLTHPFSDALLYFLLRRGERGLAAQYFGVTLVQPRVVGGA